MTDLSATNKTNLFNLDHEGLRQWFEEQGEKPFRATQVLKWIYHRGVTDFAAMTDLSKVLRDKLADTAEVRPPELLHEQKSTDGTRKWLIGFGGANAVETVFIPEPKRGTLCVSSQVGCVLNCRFCSTGAQGFSRNLTTAEIIGQVWLAARALEHDSANRKITNIVMMGMGEPLLNLDEVAPALSLMRDDFAFGLAAKRVTVSTAGVIPGIEELRLRAPEVSLAVSLHAPDDETRTQIVPLNRKYPVADLLEVCKAFVERQRKGRVTFEYTMLDGVNDSDAQARLLVKRLQGVPSKINLIPFNPFPGTDYRCSPPERIEQFQRILLKSGLVATTRRTRGQDIDAACGQLVGNVLDRTRRQAQYRQKLAGQETAHAM